LRSDLTSISEEEFTKIIDSAKTSTKKKKTVGNTSKRKDHFGTEHRMAAYIREYTSFSDTEAAKEVVRGLEFHGYRSDTIPKKGRRKLETWLRDVIEIAPDSLVMSVIRDLKCV
jgi:hypothetical protein